MSGSPDPAGKFSGDRAAMLRAISDIHAIYVPNERLDIIKRGIVDLIARDNSTSQGNVQALIAPSRAGKTKLLNDLLGDYPVEREAFVHENGDWADRKTVVLASLADSNELTVAERIYKAISGRTPKEVLGGRPKRSEIEDSIVVLARECRLKLLILDEAHQSIDLKTDLVAGRIAIMMKDLVNARLFSILVVGTEAALRLIHANQELKSRTTRLYRIQPFQPTRSDREIWAEIIGDIEDVLTRDVFGVSSNLTAPDMSEALMTASNGIVGEMVTLVEEAAVRAVDDMIEVRSSKRGSGTSTPGEQPWLDWRHFEQVFDSLPNGFGRTNPFSSAARPSSTGTAPEEAEIHGGSGANLDESRPSGVRGRSRSNHRAQAFRK